MADPPLVQLKEIALTFGGTPLFTDVELTLSPGERVCLVGRNGSGKSTLLKIAAGMIEPDRGTRFLQPGTTIRYLPQEPDFSGFMTTFAYVESGLGPGDDRHAARYAIKRLGLTGAEDPRYLSGGEARRTALARVLAPDPDILLLDEPTNHLDLPTIEWLEEEIGARRAAVVIISHDRRFLANLSRTTVWLDRGRTRRLERGFAAFEDWRDAVLIEEERAQHKLTRKIVEEEHWLRYGVTARRKRNMRRLQALKELRQARREFRAAMGKVSGSASEAERPSSLVLEAERVSKSYGERAIVADFSIRIQRGDRIGIVGPNGSGKTTLINLLTGALAPDKGKVRLGRNLEIATLDQQREGLKLNARVADVLTGGLSDTVQVGASKRHVVGYLKDFLFTPEQTRSPLGALSGGERGRLMLARALAKPSNLLVLDEPTNDLDMETLDVLEEMLSDYAGTVLLISHDRDFLDRLVNGVIAPEDGGRWAEYAGGYSDMLAQRGADMRREDVAAKHAQKAAAGGNRGVPGAGMAPAREAKPRRKLSFHEKHALDTLPKTMTVLRAKIAELQHTLADADLYARDRNAFERASSALVVAQHELAQAEERWLALEILREEIEG